MLKTILVATDGSAHAVKAVALACDLGAKYGSRLIVVHVRLWNANANTLRNLADRRALSKSAKELLDTYEAEYHLEMARAGVPTSFSSVPAPRELVDAVGGHIIKRAERAAAKAGVKTVSGVLADGDPADVVLGIAAREKADLIVLGSRGLSDLAGLFLGSVSHKVSARADCACLTVK